LILGILFLVCFHGLESSLMLLNSSVLTASTHALTKALPFACLAAPEADDTLERVPTGLVSRYPIITFGSLFGMLTMMAFRRFLDALGDEGFMKRRSKSSLFF